MERPSLGCRKHDRENQESLVKNHGGQKAQFPSTELSFKPWCAMLQMAAKEGQVSAHRVEGNRIRWRVSWPTEVVTYWGL